MSQRESGVYYKLEEDNIELKEQTFDKENKENENGAIKKGN